MKNIVRSPHKSEAWSSDEKLNLVRLKLSGATHEQMAIALGRTVGAIGTMMTELGIYAIPTTPRKKPVVIAPIEPNIEFEADEDDVAEVAAAASGSFLELLASHHPERAGELVSGPNGFSVIGGTAEKPRLVPARIRSFVPEGGRIMQPQPVMSYCSSPSNW